MWSSSQRPAQQASLFQTKHLQADLRARSVRGTVVTLAAQGLAFVLKLGSLAVLARLITKEEFGIIFAVTAVTQVIGTVKEFGLSTATQQRSDLNHDQVTALFWVNVAMSLAAMLATAALAPAVVWFYQGDTHLLAIVLAYAGIGVLEGFGVQHQALLMRQMRFNAIAAIDLTSLGVSRSVAIVLAWLGAGCWALIGQAVVGQVIGVGGAWLACRWRPGRPAWASDIRPMLAFGGNLTGVRLINNFAANADKILLRRIAGDGATGLYGNAYRVLLLPTLNLTTPLTAVAVPVLSRLQYQPERFRAYYQRALSTLTTVSLPVVILMFVAADQVVLTVLGPQWRDAALVFRILAPAAFINTFSAATTWVYSSLGRADRQIRWVTCASLARMTAISIGVFWGAIGVAAAVSLTACLLLPSRLAYCFRESPLRCSDFGLAVWRPVVASLAAGAAVAMFRCFASPAGSMLFELVVDTGVFVLAYLAALLLLPGGRAEFQQAIRLMGDIRQRRLSGARDHSAPNAVAAESL